MEDTLKSRMEDVQADMDTVRVLTDAVGEKIRFFVTETSLFGPYTDVIHSYAQDIQTLLSVIRNYIWRMDKEQTKIIDMVVEHEKEKKDE